MGERRCVAGSTLAMAPPRARSCATRIAASERLEALEGRSRPPSSSNASRKYRPSRSRAGGSPDPPAGTSPGRRSGGPCRRRGVASARNGAIAAWPSSTGPAQHSRPKITSLPCCASGTNGIGGQGITLAIVDSASGAASAAATKPAIVSAVAGRISMPPTTSGTGCRRNLNRVTTPKLPPPPRIAQNRSGSWSSSTIAHLAVGRHDLGREQAVDGEPVLAHEVADPAAGRDPAEPDRAGVAEPGREAELRGGDRVLAPRSGRCRPTRSAPSRRSRGHRGRGRRGRCRPRPCRGPRRCGRRTGPRGRGRSRGRAG